MTPAAPRPLAIAIDGPSGVGKSTVARRLAARLGIPFLDTGAMYRAIALAVLDRGIDPEDRTAVAAVAGTAEIALEPAPDGSLEVRLDGASVEARIREPRVGAATSQIATFPEVRRRLVELQRATAERHGGVLEGRDIGSQVLPDTPFKFFVDAAPAVRVERRWRQLQASGAAVERASVEAELAERDWRDSHREESPLRCDDSYVLVDTSVLGIDDVVAAMADEVARRRG